MPPGMGQRQGPPRFHARRICARLPGGMKQNDI
jgi:hypothetical protein